MIASTGAAILTHLIAACGRDVVIDVQGEAGMIEFTIFGEAQPQGSTKAFIPKGWRRPVVTSDNVRVKSWRQLVTERANLELANVPAAERAMLTGGVRLSIAFYLPRPQSLPKKITAHTKKPDLDKLVRAVCDALSHVLFDDDRQVCELVATKQYAALERPPRVTIRVEATAGVEPIARTGGPLFALEALDAFNAALKAAR